MARYTFAHYVQDQRVESFPQSSESVKTIVFSEDDMESWPAVLAEFANFLSGVYGYDIAEKVFFKDYGSEDYVPISQAQSGW